MVEIIGVAVVMICVLGVAVAGTRTLLQRKLDAVRSSDVTRSRRGLAAWLVIAGYVLAYRAYQEIYRTAFGTPLHRMIMSFIEVSTSLFLVTTAAYRAGQAVARREAQKQIEKRLGSSAPTSG